MTVTAMRRMFATMPTYQLHERLAALVDTSNRDARSNLEMVEIRAELARRNA